MILELPLVIVDVQRGGPSTGLPTKTEQSDLLQAMYGRNGESPLIVIAASTPANCFDWAYEAARLTLEHMTPVLLLTDGYIANGSEPWKIKSINDMPSISHKQISGGDPEKWNIYDRDAVTLAREWAIPGTPGFEHRVGGLEKDKTSGNISYAPENHEYMTNIRAEKVERVQNSIPDLKSDFNEEGDLLIVGWGGTFGSLHSATKKLSDEGYKIGHVHFNYINPFPKNTEAIFSKFKKIVICELNKGQLVSLLRAKFTNIEFSQYNKIQGLPFGVSELTIKFKTLIK